MVPPTAMFRASIVLVNELVAQARFDPRSRRDPRSEEHGEVRDVPAARRPDVAEHERPSGARIPQRPTPPESRNPPSGIIDSVGASRMATWLTRSSHGKSRVRENTTIAPSRTPKYTSGTTPTGDPNARYSAPHSAATGRINAEIRTSQCLPSTQVLVVAGIRADERQPRTDAIRRRSDPVQ